MQRKACLLVGLALAAIVLVACRTDAGGAVDVGALGGKTWTLRSLGGKPVLSGTEVTLEFSLAEEGVAGSAGCNRYFGDFSVKGSQLTVSALGMTEMFCMDPAGVMEQEKAYLEALGAADKIELSGEELRITAQGGQVLVFGVQ